MPAQNVIPTTNMATMMNVEELMSMEERRRCTAENRRRSICKQVIWWTCVDKECYGCYFKTNAIVDMGTTEFKWDTIIAIGIWKQKKIWANSSILEQIEHIAIFLATRPKERRELSIFGAVRLTREEGRTIVRDKKKAFNFFAAINIKKVTYLDDCVTIIDESGEAKPSTFEFYIEFGTVHTAMVFDKLMVKLNEIRIKEDFTIINEISQRTKAGIVLSILGLGHIFKQQGFWELKDLPHIINFLETELRFNDMRMTHKIRGQHPAGQGVANQRESEDTEMMMNLEQTMEERMGIIMEEPSIVISEDSEEDILREYIESKRDENVEMMRLQQLQEDILIQDAQDDYATQLQEDAYTQDAMDWIHMNRMRMRAESSVTGEEENTIVRNVRQRLGNMV